MLGFRLFLGLEQKTQRALVYVHKHNDQRNVQRPSGRLQGHLLFRFMSVQQCTKCKRACRRAIYSRREVVVINILSASHITGFIALKELCQSQWSTTTSVQQLRNQLLQEILSKKCWKHTRSSVLFTLFLISKLNNIKNIPSSVFLLLLSGSMWSMSFSCSGAASLAWSDKME